MNVGDRVRVELGYENPLTGQFGAVTEVDPGDWFQPVRVLIDGHSWDLCFSADELEVLR